jgi:3-isopropylmalate dehydrogenase
VRKYKIGVMNGDGIGPEVVPVAVALAQAAICGAGCDIEWVTLFMGWDAIKHYGSPMPEETKEVLRSCDGWIMGPHDSASYPDEWHATRQRLPGGELRKGFDLYANIRPAKNVPGVAAVVSDTDLVILRENTEGFYPDRNMFLGVGEVMPTRDCALVVGVFTRYAVTRIVRAGFEMARRRRKHLTVAHKANVLPHTTGMFKSVALELSGEYPDVTLDDHHVDALSALLVRRPETFDVIVTENMYGDILSDLVGELVGSLGLAASLNAGDTYAMAQAVHGGAPDIAGKNLANPTAEMMSVLMLLNWLGERSDDSVLIEAAARGERAIWATLGSGSCTADLGGTMGTEEFGQEVSSRL